MILIIKGIPKGISKNQISKNKASYQLFIFPAIDGYGYEYFMHLNAS